jgi:hypothetical protein
MIYPLNIILSAFSGCFLIAGLWQLEIVNIRLAAGHRTAHLPFFFLGEVDVWKFRDFADALVVAGYLLLLAALI